MLKDLYPYLNFNGQAADAMALYVKALGAVVEGDMRWRDLPDHEVPAEMADRVMHGCIRIGGHTLNLCDVPPQHELKPGNDVHVMLEFADPDALARCFEALSEGGTVRMPIHDAFWGARYGELTDAFGIGWKFNCQLGAPCAALDVGEVDGSARPSVRTCLWFDGNAAQAPTFYASLLPGSHVRTELGDGAGGAPAMVELSLAGTPYLFLNGGPTFKLSPAASIAVATSDQEQTDRLWAALTDGGEEGRCGWLVDRYGVSWQIVPDALPRLLGADDREAAGRAMAAMLQMSKIDIAALEAAFRDEGAK